VCRGWFRHVPPSGGLPHSSTAPMFFCISSGDEDCSSMTSSASVGRFKLPSSSCVWEKLNPIFRARAVTVIEDKYLVESVETEKLCFSTDLEYAIGATSR
jgi:hypothetical protein